MGETMATGGGAEEMDASRLTVQLVTARLTEKEDSKKTRQRTIAKEANHEGTRSGKHRRAEMPKTINQADVSEIVSVKKYARTKFKFFYTTKSNHQFSLQNADQNLIFIKFYNMHFDHNQFLKKILVTLSYNI